MRSLVVLLALGLSLSAQETAAPAPLVPAAEAPVLPTIFLAGDSTSQNGNPVATGWGKMLPEYFDATKVTIANRSLGGRSSRTFITEGHWDKLVAELKAGDLVIIQFGMNDGAERNGPRIARGSIDGLGEEIEQIDNVVTKKPETVHTFGWYVRKMIADVRAKGATPVLFSLTVRDFWKDGKVERGAGRYGEWARELAVSEKIAFVNHTKLIADRYEQLGHVAVNSFFPRDHVHTGEDGARLNAQLAVSGLKGLREQWLVRSLSLQGRMVPTAAPDNVYVFPQPPPKGAEPAVFRQWLNLPEAADPKLPTVWLIGDSTVRNGRGNGYDAQFGWGDPFEKYFYPGKTNLVNRAVGGTGARTFNAQWETIRPLIKKGDLVLIQFGHNDNGARGALKGIGEETEERENATTKEKETVHTFGWYLRRYIAEIREKEATPVLCTLVPRNSWKEGKIARATDSHADWTRAIAAAEKVPLVDLNELIAKKYDALGQEAVTALFADKTVHTGWAGAELNALTVVEGLRALDPNPLGGHLRPGMGVATPLPTDSAPPGR
jgi:lysophospholipase L1-like esterase